MHSLGLRSCTSELLFVNVKVTTARGQLMHGACNLSHPSPSVWLQQAVAPRWPMARRRQGGGSPDVSKSPPKRILVTLSWAGEVHSVKVNLLEPEVHEKNMDFVTRPSSWISNSRRSPMAHPNPIWAQAHQGAHRPWIWPTGGAPCKNASTRLRSTASG